MDQKHGSNWAKRNLVRLGFRNARIRRLIVCAMLSLGSAAHGQSTANAAVPPQAPAREGHAAIEDTHFWCWDTGGEGVPVVLLHPASGSGLIWGYQQPALVKAGHRVIGHSVYWEQPEIFNRAVLSFLAARAQ